MNRKSKKILVVIPLVMLGLLITCGIFMLQGLNRFHAFVEANTYQPTPPTTRGNCALQDIASPFPKNSPITLDSVSTLTQIDRWGNGQVFDVAWSPQGNLLGVARSTGVYLYKTETFELVRILEHPNARRVVFSRDGSQVATQDEFMDTRNWRADTGEQELHRTVSGFLQGDLYGPNDEFLFVAESNIQQNRYRELKTIDTGAFVTQYPTLVHFYEMSGVYDYSRSGDRFAIGTDKTTFIHEKDGTVTVWDILSGRELYKITQPDELEWAVTGLAISPDMQYLAVARHNKTIELRRADNGDLIRAIEWGAPNVETRFAANRLLFSPDGKFLAGTGDYAEPTILWDVERGTIEYVLAGNDLDIFAFSYDSRYIAVVNAENVIIQSLERGVPVATLEGSRPVAGLALHPTKPVMGYVTNGEVKIADYTDDPLDPFCTITFATDENGVEFSTDGNYLLTKSYHYAYNASIWELKTGTLLREVPDSSENTVHFYPDGEKVAVANYRSELTTHWITATLNTQTHIAPIYIQELAFSPQPDDEEMLLWNRDAIYIANSNTLEPVLEVPISGDMQTARISPDGNYYAIVTTEELSLYESKNYTLLWKQPITGIHLVAFSDDSSWLTIAGQQGLLSVLDRRNGATLWQVKAHQDKITSLDVSPNNAQIFAASEDGTISTWGIP